MQPDDKDFPVPYFWTPRDEAWERVMARAIEERRFRRYNLPADLAYQCLFAGRTMPMTKGLPEACTIVNVGYVTGNDYISVLLVSPDFEPCPGAVRNLEDLWL